MTLVTLVMVFTTQTARANYDWYDTSITIGGITADFSQWSRGNGAPDTDLGILNSLILSGVELKIWDDSNDRDGINMYFRLYDDNGQIGGDVDVWLGGAERIEGSDHDFSISYTGPFDLADEFGVTLKPGKTYYLTMWAKSYGGSGDHWYNGDGDNYHTKFTYWDPDNKTLTMKSNPVDEAYKSTSIENLIISEGVTNIGNGAFSDCSDLATVTVYAPSCILGDNAFDGCDNLKNIYVFSDKVEYYQTADNWNAYANIITGITGGYCGTTGHETDVTWLLTGESPNCTLTISGTGAMADYEDLSERPWDGYVGDITKVVIGDGVTSIGNNAFNGVEAKFATIVTQDKFYSYFDEYGNLLDNVTFDELIFQGEFSGSDLPSYIALDRSITITGDNAVLNDIGFIIAADDVTLQNMKLVANSNLGNLIDIAGENAVISNMYITYVVDEAANAINVYPGANGTQILNNKIYFESTVDGYAVDEVTNAICVNSGVSIFDDEDPIEGLVINGNEITAVIPAFLADIYENEYYVMGLSAVNGVRINGAEDFKFTNNTLNVTTNWLYRTTPTFQAMYVASSSGLIDKNTISMIDEDTPAGKDVYLYAVELVNDEDLTISNNTFNLSTTGGKEEAGAANAITAIASDFSITNNTITTESKGPNLGIYFPSRMGAPCDAAITGNIIKVTGLATSAHNTGLVSGIEIQTGDIEISGNTIYTYNIGEYAEGNYIYGISNAQDGVNSNSITDNTIYTEGKYAISFLKVDDAVITENALCAHALTGDAAVDIASGSGNTVENNILGFAMPKTGERTYNIPANVSSFKVYDDGGKGRIYSPGCDGALTLTAPEGYRLQLSGNIRTEKDVDYLSVYDGSSNLADVLINQVSSSVSGELTAIPTVTSTGQSITFYFHSDNSNKDNSEFDGLDLTVTLVYTITYNLNEGTNATGNPATYTVNTETFTLDDPSKDGYEFAGWFSDAEFNTPATTTIEQGSTDNKTFWAKWKKLMTNSDITIADIDDQEWTGSAIMPTVTVKDGETDITDQCDFEFTDNSDTGEATVTITAKSTSTDYAGSTSTTFNIVPKAVTSDGGTAITEDQDGMTAIIDETTQNGGVVPDNVTTTTLTYTRTIPNSGDAWTVCLPYEPPTGDDLKYYTLESVSGTTLNFTEVTSPQAKTPYLVVATTDTGIGAADQSVDFGEAINDPEAVDGYQFKGTLRGLDHDASVGKYILQSNNKWGIVLAEKTSVYIPPFRAYIESTSDARSLDSNLNDGTTGVDTIRTIDADGTEQWFDLSGRHIDKPTKKGLYIHNGKKEIVK